MQCLHLLPFCLEQGLLKKNLTLSPPAKNNTKPIIVVTTDSDPTLTEHAKSFKLTAGVIFEAFSLVMQHMFVNFYSQSCRVSRKLYKFSAMGK